MRLLYMFLFVWIFCYCCIELNDNLESHEDMTYFCGGKCCDLPNKC